MKIVLFIFMCGLFVGCADPKRNSDPKDELGQTIETGISLLEAQQYEQFIRLMIPADKLSEFEKEGLTVSIMVEGYRTVQGESALHSLRLITDQTPEYNDDRSLATFTIPKDLDSTEMTPVSFMKIDGKWYTKN